MSGQQMFQIVSAGKTLRSKPPLEVLQQAATTFSLSSQQARKLLLRGWVIKDQLSPRQVVEYRTQLQQIGLKIEVHPAGKFDNRALLAKLHFAEQRKNRNADKESSVAPAVQSAVMHKRSGVTPAAKDRADNAVQKNPLKDFQQPAKQPENSAAQANQQVPETAKSPKVAISEKSRAESQLVELFSNDSLDISTTVGDKSKLVVGVLAATLVPSIFVTLSLLCVYLLAMSFWSLLQLVVGDSFGLFEMFGSVISIVVVTLFLILVVLPFFRPNREADSEGVKYNILSREQAPGLYLLLKVLAQKAALPIPTQIILNRGVDLHANSPGLNAAMRGECCLHLGISAVAVLNGGELLAMCARALGYYQDKLHALASWMVLDTAERLKLFQQALEQGQAPDSESGTSMKILKSLQSAVGAVLIPVLDKLQDVHRLVTKNVAQQLEHRGDAWAAQIIGSDKFPAFSEKWHQLVHSELVVGEINREAFLVGQRLANYPQAVFWQFENLDAETRSSIEIAMAEESDCWDLSQAPDTERVYWAEDQNFASVLVRQDFPPQKLFVDYSSLCVDISRELAPENTRAVENKLLLCASKENEQAQQVLADYFNRVLPRRFISLALPQNEELASMDLQESIDWLRTRLVDLQDIEQRLGVLEVRGVSIQLGAALVKSQVSVDFRQYYLSGGTPASADESIRDNLSRRRELQMQRQQIFSVFYLRIQRTLEAMDSGSRNSGMKQIQELNLYQDLVPALDKLEQYGDLLSLMIEQRAFAGKQQELVHKYLTLASRQLQSVAEQAGKVNAFVQSGMAEALQQRSAGASVEGIAKRGADTLDLLQAMELRCKNASALIAEHYRIGLAKLLQECLAEERRRKIKPLRLLVGV